MKKLGHYCRMEYIEVPDPAMKTPDAKKQLSEQGSAILARLGSEDYVVLLDENGQEYSSEEFSRFLQKRMNSGMKQLSFLIGGAFGFSQEVRDRADSSVSFSRMTFNHEMIRVFALEQLYRAHTILRGEPYHHS
jgi:23S rRNA (pseudouridine1915-N3)-methyltransferase